MPEQVVHRCGFVDGACCAAGQVVDNFCGDASVVLAGGCAPVGMIRRYGGQGLGEFGNDVGLAGAVGHFVGDVGDRPGFVGAGGMVADQVVDKGVGKLAGGQVGRIVFAEEDSGAGQGLGYAGYGCASA
ncbi:MAG: hypothetical protein Q7T40_07350 [Methylobacter sp.]|nr:hypothetical protein [Methylobacter sp.]